MDKLTRGTEIEAIVDGEERDGRVVMEFVENGVQMVMANTEDPHWATGEYGFEAPRDDVRTI